LGSLLLIPYPAAAAAAAVAADGLAGRYRLTGEQDVASELVLSPDGRFAYFLMAGSLDEQAQGRWTAIGPALRLDTEPKPVPPTFSAGPVSGGTEGPLSLHVTTPDGHGIAAVDLVVGFDSGAPDEGYTQDYGWTLPADEARSPRWVEFAVPIYQLRSQRFPIDLAKGREQRFILTPNDIGTIDFTGVRVDSVAGRLIVHRGDARLTYEKTGPPE
jgi:hypothetical protein